MHAEAGRMGIALDGLREEYRMSVNVQICDVQSLKDVRIELVFFFFSSRRRHTRLQGDWSSDVCSSDLLPKQTFDLIIVGTHFEESSAFDVLRYIRESETQAHIACVRGVPFHAALGKPARSEERRVGKECRSRWSPYH